MTTSAITAVFVEKGRDRARWVAVMKTSIGFDHVTMPILQTDYTRDEALDYAKETVRCP